MGRKATAAFTHKELASAVRQERKNTRAKIKAQVIKNRVRGIYTTQKNRAEKFKSALDYTVEELAAVVAQATVCCYCLCNLGPKTFTLDHTVPIARGGTFQFKNLSVSCKPCNYQKGILTGKEFSFLLKVLAKFPAKASEDVRRRLTIGGKWSPH